MKQAAYALYAGKQEKGVLMYIVYTEISDQSEVIFTNSKRF
jgi:hypothetical protein